MFEATDHVIVTMEMLRHILGFQRMMSIWSHSIVVYIKSAAKTRVMDAGKVEDPSLEVIKLLWMLINKHASDLNEGIVMFKTSLEAVGCRETILNLKHAACNIILYEKLYPYTQAYTKS